LVKADVHIVTFENSLLNVRFTPRSGRSGNITAKGR